MIMNHRFLSRIACVLPIQSKAHEFSGMSHLFKDKKTFFYTICIFLFLISTVSYGQPLPEESLTPKENSTCGKVDESEFPEDLFTKGQRKCGAIILHLIFFLYCFGSIALVCTERFLPTITCICEDLELSDDVAAATFMSIATSAPEFFSNLIGTFITESDIGVGHVIGNGYYNMFFVAALGGLVAEKGIVLEWWPLARDCALYTIVAIVLTGIVWDGVIQTFETVILLILYFIYFIIMFNNKKILELINDKFRIGLRVSENDEPETEIRVVTEKEKPLKEEGNQEETQPFDLEHDFTLPPPEIPTTPKRGENDRWSMIKKFFCLPINFLIRYTIPDVRTNKFKKYYPIAFVLCVAWIGVSTYLGTWMISVIGDTIGVPDLIMGMVFMAAGGSVVEAYSVYYKAKRGECSIGLSNSLGCNNIDATLCLALPWFIKTLLPVQTTSACKNSSNIILESSYLHFNCLLLVISVIALFTVFYLNQFKLDKKLGFVCGGIYIFVLFIAISIESYGTTK